MSSIKRQEFQLQNKHRQIAQLDMMIEEFKQMIMALEEQSGKEEYKTHPTFAAVAMAQAARQRRDNLVASVDNLKNQRDVLETELAELETRYYPLARHQQSTDISTRQIMV